MSESSDSVHVLGGEVDAVVASLRAVGATALVLPRTGRHVTVLLPPTEVARWSGASPRPLLLWRFAADHALTLTLHAGGKRRATLTREPDAGWKVTGAAGWHELAGLDPDRMKALVASLGPADADLARCADDLASALGLQDVSWVSSRDLRDGDGLEDLRRRYPRATYVRAGRIARWTTAAEAAAIEGEQRAWAAEAGELVTGAPLLAPPSPPLRRGAKPKADPPWVIDGSGAITLAIQNFGGVARGVTIEVESGLLARGACRVVGIELDGGAVPGGPTASGAWRGTSEAVAWPAATNPTHPAPTATRHLRVSLEALASERGPLMIRVVPGPSPDGRGRFAVGRPVELKRR